MNPQEYFGYIRVSTQKQGEKGVSLQEQRSAIERHAERQALKIVQWFEERETAAKRGRPIFNQMLKQLRQGRVSGVIIHKIDRSARNLKDWSDLGELIDGGVEVHFANEGLDLHTRGGRLSADIQAVVAADFIRNLREETKKGMYGRIKQGFYPLPAPIGYLNRGKAQAKVIDPVKGPLVGHIFRLYASQQYNLDELCEEGARLGLRNVRGGRVTRTGLSTMLNNPFYIGLIRLKRTREMFPGIHTPLITKALFERVQGILTGRTKPYIIKHDLLFRRLLTCANCGRSLYGETQKGKVYYRCQTRSCPVTSLREDWIESQVLEQLAPLQLDDGEQPVIQKEMIALKKNWSEVRGSQINGLTLQLDQVQARLNRLTDAYLDRALEREMFEQRKSALLIEQRGLQVKMSNLKDQRQYLPDEVNGFLERVLGAYIAYKHGLPDEKRELVETTISNRRVDGKKLELTLARPFELIANRPKTTNGAQERT